jgi:stage V sporulation protein B
MPITAVRAGSSIVGSAVAVLLPAMLIKAGSTKSEALQLFGIASGMAMPILFIPSTIVGSISLVLVPELSEDFYRKNFARLSKNIERGLSVTLLVACALIPLFFVLGEDIGRVLYANELAGKMIKNCCFMLLPMSLTMISTGILNSLNFEKQTLAYYFIGAALMLAAILGLPSRVGVYAYPIGLAASYVVCATLNLFFLAKKIPLSARSLRRGLIACGLTIPVALFGRLFNGAIKKYLGAIPALAATAVAMVAIIIVFYFFCQLLSTKHFKTLFFKK